MDQDALEAIVVETLAEIAPDADVGSIDRELSFHDQLEIDSVDFMNLMLALERRLEIRIPEADYPKLSTLGGALAYLTDQTAADAPAEAAEGRRRRQ